MEKTNVIVFTTHDDPNRCNCKLHIACRAAAVVPGCARVCAIMECVSGAFRSRGRHIVDTNYVRTVLISHGRKERRFGVHYVCIYGALRLSMTGLVQQGGGGGGHGLFRPRRRPTVSGVHGSAKLHVWISSLATDNVIL